ncbi:hypothetical protein ACWDTP_13235 [Mycobacterium sp. NPDC003449]
MRGAAQGGPTVYRLHVIARDAADVAAHVAGLICDRVMGGWRVTVALRDNADAGPVRILGATIVDGDDDGTGTGPDDDDRWVLAVDADLYRPDDDGQSSRPTEVLVWGRSPEPGRTFEHRLSAAGRAFKAEALAAAGVEVAEIGVTERFACVDVAQRAALHA